MQSTSDMPSFGDDFNSWRVTADALLAADSSHDTKKLVVDHLQKIQVFLHRNLEQEEDSTKDAIEKELQEIERLKNRIEKSRERQDTSGSSLEDVLVLYDTLGMSEWQQAFDALIVHTNDTEQAILEKLLHILQADLDLQWSQNTQAHFSSHSHTIIEQTIYGHCQKKHGQTQKDMVQQAYLPADTKKKKVPSKILEELGEAVSMCQVDITTASLKKFCEAANGEIRKQNPKINDLLMNRKIAREVKEAYAAYFDKCLEFCLLLALAIPTIDIIDKPKAKNKKVQQLLQAKHPQTNFKELGKHVFVKWPALVQEERIIRPLSLYLLGSGAQARRDRECKEEYRRLKDVVQVEPESNKLVRNKNAIDTI